MRRSTSITAARKVSLGVCALGTLLPSVRTIPTVAFTRGPSRHLLRTRQRAVIITKHRQAGYRAVGVWFYVVHPIRYGFVICSLDFGLVKPSEGQDTPVPMVVVPRGAVHAGMLGLNLSKPQDFRAFYNATLAAARDKFKRHADLLEPPEQLSKNETLEARDTTGQTGNIRMYKILSHSMGAAWPGELIESSKYPNGNQGDDLIQINGDPHRYVVTTQSCEPDGYTLMTHATKSEARGIWVSEHILELNTIGRYMMSSLDGGLGSSSSSVDTPAYSFDVGKAYSGEVQRFADMTWPPWNEEFAISPADVCLAQLGSTQHTDGLVVCDSKLNGMKTRIYKLENPVGESTWETHCISPTSESLGRALGAIQLIMAVFDYYDDTNVKGRHQQVYNDVMATLGEFMRAYDIAFGGWNGGQFVQGKWERRWRHFMSSHFMRVLTHTRLWLVNKLDGLDRVWHEAYELCGSDEGWCTFCLRARTLVAQHQAAIQTQQRVNFDFSIFNPWLI